MPAGFFGACHHSLPTGVEVGIKHDRLAFKLGPGGDDSLHGPIGQVDAQDAVH